MLDERKLESGVAGGRRPDAAYSACAFVFGLVYDSLFPIDSERWMVEIING